MDPWVCFAFGQAKSDYQACEPDDDYGDDAMISLAMSNPSYANNNPILLLCSISREHNTLVSCQQLSLQSAKTITQITQSSLPTFLTVPMLICKSKRFQTKY